MKPENKEDQHLILIDEDGKPLGIEEREQCHQGTGLLHDAFLVMAFNSSSEPLLTKRSLHKKLWPGFWDGSVASHFLAGKDYNNRIIDRIKEEIGIDCRDIQYLTSFRYHSFFKDVGSENELCRIYTAHNIIETSLKLNNDEISEYRFISIQNLLQETNDHPEIFAPWFLTALKKYLETDPRSKLPVEA